MQKPYAFFDFDGTLCKGDSIIQLCQFAAKQGLSTRRQLLKGIGAAIRFKLGRLPIERAKEEALCWMKGRTEDEMADFAQRFCNQILKPRFFPEGIATLERLLGDGYTVLLITASPAFYLMPMKEILGVHDVIGTQLALDEDGRYTGQVTGANCRGAQKPVRIKEYLAAKGDEADPQSCAFGNSTGDLPMMALCRQKTAVNPSAKMARALKEDPGATIVHWGIASAPAKEEA